MSKHLLILSTLLMLAVGCKRGADDDMPGQTPVAFTARLDGEEATRAEINTENLASMGVFACYTGQGNWAGSSSTSNFMYNQPVEKSDDVWTYTPIKYWPNMEGDKLSFFAYAPHSEKVKGFATYGYNSSNATGFPTFSYEPPVNITEQTDLLFAPPLLNKTKGSELSFKMGHVLTHVLFKVKSTSNMTVSKLTVNKGAHSGYLSYNESSYSWTSIGEKQTFNYEAEIDVPENTLTDICESFLLPQNAESVTLTFTEEGSATEQTETIALPSSPVWAMNKTVAYTIGIENKTKITLSVKAWDTTGPVNGIIGEEPTGTYPFMKNGIIYENEAKSYYVGPDYYYNVLGGDTWGQEAGATAGWYKWEPALRLCRGWHSFGTYGTGEWRLPSKTELGYIIQFMNNGSTYWSTTPVASTGRYWAYSGGKEKGDKASDTGSRLLCIRDLGSEMTYPTVRKVGGIPVVYISASHACMVQPTGNEIKIYDDAVAYCNGLSYEGYNGWRLPSKEEATWILNLGVKPGTTYWTSTNGSAVAGSFREVISSTGGWVDDTPQGVLKARTYCVRNY